MPGHAAACRASRRRARAPRAPRPPGATPRARASGPRPRPRHPRARSSSRQSPPSAPRSPAAAKSAGPVGTSRRGAHMAACSPLAPHHLPAPVLPRCHMLPAQALRREHPSADRAHLLSHCRPLAAFPGLVERAGSRGVTLARRAPGLLSSAALVLVYEHPLSPYAQKVKIALAEKGVAFECRMLDFISGRDDAFTAANPSLEVPALVDVHIRVFDSTIILEYFEDRWPSPPLLPA